MKSKITPSPRVIAGTNGTVEGLIALDKSLQRGAKLVAQAKLNIEKSKKLLG